MDIIEHAVADVLDGNLKTFSNIINCYQADLIKYVRYLTHDNMYSEDIVQEVFIKVYHNLHKYKAMTSFKNWIYKITYNHTMTVLKKLNKSKIVQLEDYHDVASDKSPKDFSTLTTYALRHLTIEERQLMYFRVYDEISFKELSLMMGKTEVSLRKKYERAKKKFIKNYQKEGEYDGRKDYEETHLKSY
jgi:RNA polymerase sigma-70 factor (ECF subfamily)